MENFDVFDSADKKFDLVSYDYPYGEQQVVRGRGGVEGAELGVWQVADGGGAGQRVIGYPQGHRAAEGVAVCRQALELQRLLRRRHVKGGAVRVYVCVSVCVCVCVCTLKSDSLG